MTEETSTPAAHGGLFRERGTLRIVLGAVGLAIAWFAYDTVSTSRLMSQAWPPLQHEPAGLTVLGLQDTDRPGKPRRYIAIERSHSWQFRRPEDATEEPGDADPAAAGEPKADKTKGISDTSAPESQDRGAAPAGAKRAAAGEIVEIDEIVRTCPIFLNGRHFAAAGVDERTDLARGKFWEIWVTFTPEGRSRYYQFSRSHQQERAVFILKDEVITCPRMAHQDTSQLTIGPIWVRADAEKLAAFINGGGK